MTTFASDAFGGTAGTELSAYSANWSKVAGATGDAVITAAGRVRASSTTAVIYGHATAPASADYSVQADVHFASSAGAPRAGVVGRADASAASYYQFGLQETSGSVEGLTLDKVVSGTATQLGRDTTISYTAPNTCKLDMSGSTIKGIWNGVEKFSVTDTSISAAGKAGLRFINTGSPSDSTTYHLDNWIAEEAGGAPTLPALSALTTKPGTLTSTGFTVRVTAS